MSRPQMAKSQWLVQNSADMEYLRESLQKEQRELAAEWRKLEREKEEFHIEQQAERKRLAQERQLFDMKWKILEEELRKMAKEKQEIAQEKKKRQSSMETYRGASRLVEKEMFFSGVSNELGMRKRYKDLIKIYHPDNLNGDTNVLQAINQEYDELKKLFCG